MWMIPAINAGCLQGLNELISDILSSYLHLYLGVRQGIALKDRDCVTDALTTLDYEATNATRRVHTQSSSVHNCQ